MEFFVGAEFVFRWTWGVHNIMRRVLGQPLLKHKVATGSRGATGSEGVGLGVS